MNLTARLLALHLVLLPASAALAQTTEEITPISNAADGGSQISNPILGSTTSNQVPTTPLRWGPAVFHAQITYRYQQANGIQSAPGRPQDTVIQSLTPSLSAEIGNHWSLSYSPSFTEYSSEGFTDTVGHAASLEGHTTYDAWSLLFSQEYNLTSQPMIETSRQIREENHITTLDVTKQIGFNFSLQSELSQTLRFTDDGNDINQWSLLELLHFPLLANADTSAGVRYSYSKTESGIQLHDVEMLGNISLQLTQKLELDLNTGVYRQRYVSTDTIHSSGTKYTAGMIYAPFTHTILSASVDRAVTIPHTTSQQSTSTNWKIGLGQRLFGRVQCSINAGRIESSYRNIEALNEPVVDNQNRWYDIRLSTLFMKRLSVAIFYGGNKNTSSDTSLGFDSTQQGFELNYRY